MLVLACCCTFSLISPATFTKITMSAEADVQLHDFKSIFGLNGKVAVVTGGSRGLGLHAASG